MEFMYYKRRSCIQIDKVGRKENGAFAYDNIQMIKIKYWKLTEALMVIKVHQIKYHDIRCKTKQAALTNNYQCF